jgi:hypothetical protein
VTKPTRNVSYATLKRGILYLDFESIGEHIAFEVDTVFAVDIAKPFNAYKDGITRFFVHLPGARIRVRVPNAHAAGFARMVYAKAGLARAIARRGPFVKPVLPAKPKEFPPISG